MSDTPKPKPYYDVYDRIGAWDARYTSKRAALSDAARVRREQPEFGPFVVYRFSPEEVVW